MSSPKNNSQLKITTFRINNNGTLQKHRLTTTCVNNNKSINAKKGLCEWFHIQKLANKNIHLNFICGATMSQCPTVYSVNNRVFSPRLGTGLSPCRVAVDSTSGHQLSRMREDERQFTTLLIPGNKPYKHTRQIHVHNQSLFTHQLYTGYLTVHSTFHTVNPCNISHVVK